MEPSILKPIAIKRDFIRKFAKNKKLSTFQKNVLTQLIASIRVDYEVSPSRFSKFIKENQNEIEDFMNDLDPESKDDVDKILKNLEYMNTHSLIETIKNYLYREEEVFKHMKYMESIKNKYKLPVEIYEESIFKYKHGLKFLPQNIIKSLNNKDFLDCGAYNGDSALMFVRDYNPNNVYSFEPILSNYNSLLENIKLNNLKNVIPINKGVGEKSCILNFYSLDISSYVSETGNERIDVVSIDEFVSENHLSVGLIKMDVEGYELEVLKGAKRTIKEFKPVLLIGIYHNPEEFFRTNNYIQGLIPDYKFKIKFLSDIRPFAEVHLIAW